MNSRHLFVVLVMAILTPTAVAGAGLPKPALPFMTLPHSTFLESGHFRALDLTSFSNATTITFQMNSNVSVSTALMTPAQFAIFNGTSRQVAGSLFDQNGTQSQHTFDVGQGHYYLVFYANVAAARVNYVYDVFPATPLELGPLTPPLPTGIASFGLYNDSGNLQSYTVQTDEVVGVADISAVAAFNSTASASQNSVSGMSLQLNSMLAVQQADGSEQTYWCQDIPVFVTANAVVAPVDNIWNASVNGLLANGSITSQGGLGRERGPSGGEKTFYGYYGSNSTYALPLELVMLMRETTIQGEGVTVQMGIQVVKNGTVPATPISWFDNATIHDSGVTGAYFLTTGSQTAPNGLFYDTELVFGGESNSESTSFPQMNATVGLFYSNGSSGDITAFPSYFGYGWDTAEWADNLRATGAGNGFASISTGTPDYNYLGTATGSFNLTTDTVTTSETSTSTLSTSTSSTMSISTTSATSTTSTASSTISLSSTLSTSTTSTSTTSTPTASTSTTSALSTSSLGSGGASVPEFSAQLGIALLITVAIAMSYVLTRRSARVDKKTV